MKQIKQDEKYTTFEEVVDWYEGRSSELKIYLDKK